MAARLQNPSAGAQVVSLIEVRVEAHRDLAERDALAETKLSEHPDYDLPRRCVSTAGTANRFLIKARRQATRNF
jgi:hypothetical protein